VSDWDWYELAAEAATCVELLRTPFGRSSRSPQSIGTISVLSASRPPIRRLCTHRYLRNVFRTLLTLCAFLTTTLVSGESAPARRSVTFSGFVILRHLAIPAGSVVGSRALRMLLALALNVTAVFLPAFLFSDLGGLGVS
jgi:hypothetical protein